MPSQKIVALRFTSKNSNAGCGKYKRNSYAARGNYRKPKTRRYGLNVNSYISTCK